MSIQLKSILSLTILVMLGLSVVSKADAGSSRFSHLTDEQIQVCVSEISRHADYDNASRDLLRFRIAPSKSQLICQILVYVLN